MLAAEDDVHRIAVVRKEPELPNIGSFAEYLEYIGYGETRHHIYDKAQQDMLSNRFVQEVKDE